MADYAIGDIQGCYERLLDVMALIEFDPAKDRLWVAGDLVNRGPDSLMTLRYIHALGDAATVVLGNHDLHLLAVAHGGHDLRKNDTLKAIFDAPDCDKLLEWLRRQPLACYDRQRDLFMAHAGLPHMWSAPQALALADEVAAVLRGADHETFFAQMYGNEPACWNDSLQGMARWRAITNYFTRMRFIRDDGTLDLVTKESADKAPEGGFRPWFEWSRADATRVVFGHWAALQGETGSDRFIGLDTGCVWGGTLTVMDLDTGRKVSCPCD